MQRGMIFLLVVIMAFAVLGVTAQAELAEGYEVGWARYIGGEGGDRIQGIAVAAGGSIYITGNTASGEFPVTEGAYQSENFGGQDAFVARMGPSGDIIWSTYIGGDQGDFAQEVAVDESGVYIIGSTDSGDMETTEGAYQRTFGGNGDIFVAKFAHNGSLIWNTFVGGAGEDGSMGLTIYNGDVYFTGSTVGAEFPVTSGSHQTTPGGEGDGVLGKLSGDGSTLEWSTYIGGDGHDSLGSEPVVHSDGTVYVAGTTNSLNLSTPGVYQPEFAGGVEWWGGDAFVARYNAAGSELLWFTYLGGEWNDETSFNSGLDVDNDGRVILVGETFSLDFPTTEGAFQQNYSDGQDAFEGFVSILSADGSDLIASTYLGGPGFEELAGATVDDDGRIYVTGETRSETFPTFNSSQSVMGGGAGDVFLTVLESDLSGLAFSTFIGNGDGDQVERGRDLAIDEEGNIYIVGDTESGDFPVTGEDNFSGVSDAFVMKFDSILPSIPDDPDPDPEDNETTAIVDEDESGMVPMLVYVAGTSVVMLGILALMMSVERFRHLLLFGIYAPLYSKLRKEKVLNNDLRKDVLDTVTSMPGVHFRELLRTTELANGVAAYHLSVLEREGYIKSQRKSGKRFYYPSEFEIPVEEVITKVGLKDRIMEQIEDRPGLTQVELASDLEMTPQRLNYHIKALEKTGSIRKVKQGRSFQLFSTDT